MANIKITELTNLTDPSTTDVMPVVDVDADVTKKVSVGEVVGKISGDVDVATDGTATISELPVSKLADGTARQLLQTDAAGTGVEWTSNVDIPGTLDVTGAAAFDSTGRFIGDVTLDSTLIFEGSTADGFETTLTVVDPTADRTITLPDVTGTVITTGDTGTVTSTMISDGTIVNADVNASAAIAGTKIDPDFGSQTIETTGVINAGAGTAAAPSVSVGATDNGLYSPGTDQVAISTSGTGRLLIDANGRLYLGTTAAGSASADNFNIGGSGSTGITIRSGTSSAGGIHFSDGTSGNDQFRGIIAYDHSGDYMRFYTDAVERLRITSDGKLGLGTSSPATTLDVNGDVTITDKIIHGSDTNTAIRFPAADTFAVETAGTERLRVDSSGNVGIGTTSPGNALVVREAANANDSAYIEIVSGNNAPAGVLFGDTDASPRAGIFYHHADESLRFYRTGFNESARIDSSGRLLVGTSSTQAVGTSTSGLSQLQATSSSAYFSVARHSNDAFPPAIALGKSRATSVNGVTVLTSGDQVGSLRFCGADGTDIETQAASIDAFVDGTPGVNDMPGRLVFSTTADGQSSPDPRMTITSAGHLRFGQTTTSTPGLNNTTTGIGIRPAGELFISVNGAPASYFNRNGTNGSVVSLRREGVEVGTISVTTSATAYNTSSDYRLKDNVVPLTGAADRVNQLQVHRFNFIADPDTTVDGFIAHEAQEVVPECVTGVKDEVDDEGNPVYQGIDQSKLVPLLTAALQEALGRIETLEAEVAALKAS